MSATTVADMGFIFNRRKTIAKGTTANVSKSGVSVSKKVGRVSVNSRGKASINLGKGIRFKI